MRIETIIWFKADMRRTVHAILNRLATPEGYRFCQPSRFQKKRAYAEAWLELRSKWIKVLQRIEPSIHEGYLPYDDGKGKGVYTDSFKIKNAVGADIYISVCANQAEAQSMIRSHNFVANNQMRFWICWDDAKEDFVLWTGFGGWV